MAHHILMTGTAWHQTGSEEKDLRWVRKHHQTSEPAGFWKIIIEFHLLSPAFTCVPFDNCLPFRADWIGAIDLVPEDLTKFRHENEIWPGAGRASSCLEQSPSRVRGWICSMLFNKVTLLFIKGQDQSGEPKTEQKNRSFFWSSDENIVHVSRNKK